MKHQPDPLPTPAAEPALGPDEGRTPDSAEGDECSHWGATIERAVVDLRAGQDRIEQHLELLAQAIEPIATRTYDETVARVRALEKKILARQERPTVVRLHQLACGVHRLSDATDVKAHVEETVLDILAGLGYEQFGELGDPINESKHEVVAATPSERPVATSVHARGLESFGDVVVRARVEAGDLPAPTANLFDQEEQP